MESYSSSKEILIDIYFYKQLEEEMGSAWLIERLFSRGSIQDIKNARKYFGDEKIKQEVIMIKWLSKEDLNLFSGIFNIPKEDFLTYQLINSLNNSK